MRNDDLKLLPLEVKALINDGVYSLYEVSELSPATYVLLTNAREIYCIDAVGAVVPSPTHPLELSKLKLVRAVHFKDVDQGAALKVNYV